MEIKSAWIRRTCPNNLRNKKITSRDFYDLGPGEEPVQKQSSPSPRKKKKNTKIKNLLENLQFSDDSISDNELSCSASPISVRNYAKPTSNKNDRFQPVVRLQKLSTNTNTEEANLNENIPVENENTPAEKDKVWFLTVELMSI